LLIIMAPLDWLSGRVFNFVHHNNLVYNTCWEDPRLDRAALEIGPDDTVVVITSAGCNTLDYALTAPKGVYAVDLNPRQNALLELKLAGIRRLEYEDFWRLFGEGYLPGVARIYRQKLRADLSPFGQKYWDPRIGKFFGNRRRPFYFRGTAGGFARMVNLYIDKVIRVRPHIAAILDAADIDEQRRIFNEELRDRFWSKPMCFAMNRDATLSLVGVPRAQRRQVERDYEGGVVKFVQDCVETVFAELPLQDNYFWRVYLTGRYAPHCCPEYLKADNFERLKGGLADRVHVATGSMQSFLERHDGLISRFVLLDHMDWLSDRFYPSLEAEWQAIFDSAAPSARVLWRSGGLRTDFVDRAQVRVGGRRREVGELLHHHALWAAALHLQDRVHTYGSFYIADVAA
jgi:S-adenosylmethionine-diacylglycerol 3-amino-3-carboxypropyl transferase